VAQTGSKDTLYQGGVNVPMFISGPAVTRTGERESALISHTDFFPTIAELSGANLPAYQDGRSFADLLSDASSATREDTYTESNDGWTARNDTLATRLRNALIMSANMFRRQPIFRATSRLGVP